MRIDGIGVVVLYNNFRLHKVGAYTQLILMCKTKYRTKKKNNEILVRLTKKNVIFV